MNLASTLLEKLSADRRIPRRWPLFASWLLVSLSMVVLFAAGLPVLVDNLRDQYTRSWGMSLLPGGSDERRLTLWIEGQAVRAGVMERDVLVAVDGRPVEPPEGQPDLDELIPAGPAGTPVTLLVRTGERPAREVVLVRGGADGQRLARWGIPVEGVFAMAVGVELLVALVTVGVAAFIFWRRPDERAAWTSSLALIAVFAGAGSLPVQALYFAQLEWQIWLDLWFSLVLGILLLFLSLFPTGRFAPGWSIGLMGGWLVWATAGWFWPDLYFWRLETPLFLTGLAVALGMGIAAQIGRFRFASTRREKQQTKWVVWGVGVALVATAVQMGAGRLSYVPAPVFDLLLNPVTRLLQLAIPVTLALAILQRRLWEIDLIYNRTLVYGGLSLGIVAVYMLVVGAFGALFQTQGSFLFSLLATGLIAVLFQPVRERLQRGINRMMFGERDDPYAVLSQLGRRLGETAVPGQTLPAMAQSICQSLKLPYAAIIMRTAEGGRQTIAASGTWLPQLEEWPLRYQGEVIGWLVVAPRSPGEPFTGRERRLLEDIASQAGAAAYAARLHADLQRSREKLVLTREEERRRIRRDLHDELGPSLASQTFALDAALDQLESDPAAAAALLRGLKEKNRGLMADIRRLVYELRPPTLDELGVVEALNLHVNQLNGRHATSITLTTPPEGMAMLPAAVEVAVYRLAQEGLHNVLRHAEADHCEAVIRFEPGQLVVEIHDDGRGFAAGTPAGVGLSSMRERVEELGGRLTIESAPGAGTHVKAALPFGGALDQVVGARPED